MDVKEALSIVKGEDAAERTEQAAAIKDRYRSKVASACSIYNAKSGSCPENCKFCAQSAHYGSNCDSYPFVGKEKILAAAKRAVDIGASRFSIITSGYGISSQKEMDEICQCVEYVKSWGDIRVCASLGVMSKEQLEQLRNAGLDRYHHNLEASRSYYGEVCTTRSYEENYDTAKYAKEVGLEICCGGIFGMGESMLQRAELVCEIASLEPSGVPCNFLCPIPNTPLGHLEMITTNEGLAVIRALRIALPESEIFVCGGREGVFKDRQDEIFANGADGFMTGDYLTTKGDPVEKDKLMLRRLGFRLESELEQA
ncbi:MAG: biotin synthase BioB [Planctomycetota bacterium]|nr:biotin synthase BioB [Planctomycetota bacterium]